MVEVRRDAGCAGGGPVVLAGVSARLTAAQRTPAPGHSLDAPSREVAPRRRHPPHHFDEGGAQVAAHAAARAEARAAVRVAARAAALEAARTAG